MSNQKIIIKNSSGTTTPSLQYGELAIKYLNGSEALYSKNSANQIIAFNDWAKILNKPTTLSGYGITDALNTSSTSQTKSGALTLTGGFRSEMPAQNYNPFSSYKIFDSIDTNLLIGRANKIKVSVNGVENTTAANSLFNQNYEEYNIVCGREGDAPLTLNIDLVSKGLYGGNGITYASGYVYLHFYSAPLLPATYTARVKNKDNVWYDMTLTPVTSSTLKGTIPIALYLKELEFTFTTGTGSPYVTSNIKWGLTEVEYHGARMSLSQGGKISSVGGYIGGSLTVDGGVVGNASSATKLQTSRTIWGQSFDGTGNVSGSMYGVRSINNDVIDYMTTGGQYFYTMSNNQSPLLTLSSNVGIGTTDPQYKLDVSGDIRSNYMYFKKYNDNGVAGYVGRGATNNNNLQLLSYSGNSVYIGANENDVDGITINTSNNVGIGTTSPSYKLDVNGSVRTGTIIIDEHVSDAGIKINNNSNTYSRIRFFDSVENLGTIHAFTGNQFLFNNQKCINIDSNGAISLGHWNEPNLYINTVNGCVGISNTNPQFKLDVYGASRIYGSLHLNNEGWLNLYNGANTSTISLSHNNASSKLDIYNRTLGNWANVEAGFLTCDTITMKNNLSEKFIRSNAWGGAIRLRANSGAATDRGLQLGRVDNNLAFTSFMAFNGDSGNVSIASTLDNGYKLDVNGSGHYASELYLDYGLRISNAAGSGEGISLFAESSTNPNYGLMFARTVYKGTHGAVNGDWATYFTMSPDSGRGWIFTNSASSTNGNVASISNTGNFTASGEVTAYSASDIRLKTNIKPIMSAIDVINKLNPVTYNWNEKAKELNPLKDDSTEYGLIAQELEVVMPELVHTIYDKYKSIDYVKLVPILIKAVQEQQKQINELKQNRWLS